MFSLKIKKSRVALLFLVFKLMTSNMSDSNHDLQNRSNYSVDEYSVVINISLEVVNSSLEDNNYTTTIYETVTVRLASPIDVYFTPCLMTLGISGNMLALYVFFSSKLRHQSTSQYLSALAISDSIFLAELCPPWLNTMQINSIFNRGAFCKMFVYISYVTCCLSSWLVIAFTVERFIAVQYPLQRPSVCTVRRARYIIITLTLGSMLINLPVIHFAGAENQECHVDRDKLEQAARFNWVDTTVTFTIPLLLIIFFNTWIAAAVYRLERDRTKLTHEEVRTAAVTRRYKPRDSDYLYLRSQRRITNMLLIVSSIFVLFNCPAYTLRVCGYAYNMESTELDDKWLTAQNVAMMMFNSNFGINFFLYCLTGQNFRRTLTQRVPCCGWIARTFNSIFNRSPAHNGRNCSITTSAASTGTDATCTEMSVVRPNTRQTRRRSGRYIMRWTFDNSRQRRAAGVSGEPESIGMSAIVTQPRPSRVITDDLSIPGTSYGPSVQTRAIIERRRPIMDGRLSSADQRPYSSEPRRIAADLRRPSSESRGPSLVPRCPEVESRRHSIELRHPATSTRSYAVGSRRLSVDLGQADIESGPSTNELTTPPTELRHHVSPRVNLVGMRRSSFM